MRMGSSLGLLMNGYDLTLFSIVILFLPASLRQPHPGIGPLGAAVLGGMLVGSWSGGALGDRLGRRWLYRLDMGIVALCAAASVWAHNPWWLFGLRFVLGIGNGVDYPIAASMTAEFASGKDRGRDLIGTIGAWTIGAFVAYGVALGVVHLVPRADVWRGLFGSEALLAVLIVMLRKGAVESPKWMATQQRLTVPRGQSNETPSRLFSAAFLPLVLFTAGSWFLYDIADYGSVIFTPYMLARVGLHQGFSVILLTGLATVVASLIGIAATWFLIHPLGTKRVQVIGYAMMVAVFGALAGTRLPLGGFAVLLGVLYLFMDGGPGQTTYVYPGQVFPTEVRAAGHGFASAVSRAGAIVGVLGFPWISGRLGFHASLWAFAAISFLALMLTIRYGPAIPSRVPTSHRPLR